MSLLSVGIGRATTLAGLAKTRFEQLRQRLSRGAVYEWPLFLESAKYGGHRPPRGISHSPAFRRAFCWLVIQVWANAHSGGSRDRCTVELRAERTEITTTRRFPCELL